MSDICISNDFLAIRIDKSTLSIEIVDKQSGQVWRANQLFSVEYHGRPLLTPAHCRTEFTCESGRMTLHLSDFRYWARWPEHYYCRPESGPDLRITLEILLLAESVRFIVHPIENIGDAAITVSFPYRMGEFPSSDSGGLVLPYNAGVLISFPREHSFNLDSSIYDQISMPIFGVLHGSQGLFGIINTPFDCSLRAQANRRRTKTVSVDHRFLFDGNRLDYIRSVDYFFLQNAGYVEMAKIYRKHLIDSGKFVSIDQKIAANPEVEKLVGAVVWKHNVFCKDRPRGVEKDYSLYMMAPEHAVMEGKPANWIADELFEEAHARGFDRLVVYNTGWNLGDYDSMYPSKFPPNILRGTEDDFTEASVWARSISDGYIYSIHDNYSDAYENSLEWNTSYLLKGRNGELSGGCIWRGGRAYVICPVEALKFAKRDLPRIASMVGKGSIYIDVFGNAKVSECFDKDHPLTREEDANFRIRLFELAKTHIGSVATEGPTHDFLAGVVDMEAFFPIHAPDLFEDGEPPLPIPLYQLVYHDSVLNYTTESIYGFYGAEYLLYVALYNLLPFSLDEVSLKLSRELRDTYKSEMLEHKFLTKCGVDFAQDGTCITTGVQQTVFSDGTSVVANFETESYMHGQEEIAARSFAVFRGDRRII